MAVTKITLSWTKVSGATSYNAYAGSTTAKIKKLTTVIGDVATIDVPVADLTAADAAITAGVACKVTLTASNANGESAQSPELSVPADSGSK